MITVKILKVRAIDPCKMSGSGKETLKVGKEYEVKTCNNNYFSVINEEGGMHKFTIDQEEGKFFKSKFFELEDYKIESHGGRVHLTDSGLEYFVSWFGNQRDEEIARKRHTKGKGFKILRTDISDMLLKCKGQEWWVGPTRLALSSIKLV